MKTSTTSAVLSCTPDTFWAVFLDPRYLEELYLGELGYGALAVIETGKDLRKVRVVPKMNLPGPVAKLIGDSFAYEEHGSLARSTNQWTWRMVQPANLDSKRKPRKDVVTMHGAIRVEPMADGHCRRIDDFTIEARIFGLSGLIESTIEKELRSARAKEYAFVTRWIAQLGA